MATLRGNKWEYMFIYLSQFCTLHYWKSLTHLSTQSIWPSRAGCVLYKHTHWVATQFQEKLQCLVLGRVYGVELQLQKPVLSEDCEVVALIDSRVQKVLIYKTNNKSTFARVACSTFKASGAGRRCGSRGRQTGETCWSSNYGRQNTLETRSIITLNKSRNNGG